MGFIMSLISIHAPREGSDIVKVNTIGQIIISIHAPREGSDTAKVADAEKELEFQSTLPARGATAAL